MLKILLSYLIYLPAAILCFLPVRENLKHSFTRTIALLLPLFLLQIVLASLLTWRCSLRQNDLLLPTLLLCFLAYHFSLSLPLAKTLGVFSFVVSLLSILTNYAACFDAARNPDSGLGTFTLAFSLIQFGATMLAILILAWPFIKHGPFIIEQPIPAGVWIALTGFSLLVIISNIAFFPVIYYLYHEKLSVVNASVITSAQLAIWILMLLILFSAISGLQAVSKIEQERRIFEMKESQFLAQQKYIKASEKTRHDFRHNILTLAQLYNDGDMESVGLFLKEYIDAMPKNESKHYCSNTSLNALLNYYAHIASLNQIDLTLRVGLPDELSVSDVDLCSMVGNILDNAVTACLVADEKMIQLTILSESNTQLFIVAVNSFNGIVNQKNGVYRSTKANRDGIGLSSIAATAKSYGGVAQFSHEGNRFFTNVSIPLEQQ